MMSKIIHTPVSHPDHHAIGHDFKAWDGHVYTCDSWEENLGYWMFRTDENNELVRRNVSERAVGGTFHKIWEE